MEELSLVISNPGDGEFLKKIAWNKEEFMELVASVTEEYKGLTFIEDQIKDAKAARAKLNAMKKAISDRRIEVKKSVMAPYDVFEAEVKEVVALIDDPIDMIDRQIKESEERAKEEKKTALADYFVKEAKEYEEFLTFDMLFDKKYLNASTSLNMAKKEIKAKIDMIAMDIRSVEGFTSEKYRMASMDVYKRTLDVNKALAEDKRLNELDKKAEEEKQRKEEEAAERAAQEAKKAESVAETAQSVPEFAENVSKAAETVINQAESVINQAETVIELPSGDPTVSDSFSAKEVEKMFTASFKVVGTKSQIMALKQYMIDNNIQFGKVEK